MKKNNEVLNGHITTFDQNGNALWEYGTGYYKAYTEHYETKEDIAKVPGVHLANRYFTAAGSPVGWDFVVPEARLLTVVKILKRGAKK